MKRSRLEIMSDILQVCLSPSGKTQVMYKNNLSFTQLNTYLEVLISLKLLAFHTGKYKTTQKGRIFLSSCKRVERFVEPLADESSRFSENR